MNKQESIRSLTWKYFWQQKWEEISECLKFFSILSIGVSSFIAFFAGLILLIGLATGEDFSQAPTSIIIGTIIIWVSWIIYGIHYWIKSNWQKAEKRARRKIK